MVLRVPCGVEGGAAVAMMCATVVAISMGDSVGPSGPIVRRLAVPSRPRVIARGRHVSLAAEEIFSGILAILN